MKLYMNLGQRNLEEWLIQTVGDRIQFCTYDESEYVLVNRLNEAQVARDAGKTVLFVAGQDKDGKTKSQKARQLGIERTLHWTWREKEGAASLILTFLLTADKDLPSVELRDEPFKIVIRSAMKAGGTFLAWNLQAVLCAHGLKAQLMATNVESLAAWGVPATNFAEETARDGNADVWVIDASGRSDADVQGDADIMVRGVDPEYHTTNEKCEKWKVVNRVPTGAQDDFTDAQLIIPDYGYEAYQSMKNGVAVATTCDVFSSALWSFWEAVRSGKTEGRLVVEDVHIDVDLPSDQVADQNIEDGFELDDDSEESGFDLDL